MSTRRRRQRSAAPERRWPRTSSLWCLALAVLLATISFGAYLNDEAAQLQGVENARRGTLEMEERSLQFYAVADGVLLPGWNLTTSHNAFVSVSAVPAYGVLWVTSLAASPTTILLLGWSAAAYVSVTRGWARAYEGRTGRPWSWYRDGAAGTAGTGDAGEARGLRRAWDRVRRMSPAHWAVVGVLALWTFAQWIQTPGVDYATWGEVFAVQVTHTLAAALGFVLFYRVVQEETDSPRAAALAGAALLLGPFVFWGVGIKYHAASMVLAVAALWLYRRPGAWRFTAFAAATAGVVATPLGAPVLVGLAVVEAARLARGRRDGRQVALAAGGLAASAAVLWFYVLLVPTSSLAMLVRGGDLSATVEATRAALRFEDPRRSLLNLWGVFVDSRALPGAPLAVWALSPLAALAVLAPLRLRGRWTRTTALAAASSVLFVALFVHAAHTQGDGQDNRFFATMLPGLLLLGAVVAAPRLEGLDAPHWSRVWRTLGVASAASLVVLLVLGATKTSIVPGEPLRQLLNAGWLLGTASWLGLVALEAVPALRARLGEARAGRWYATLHGVGLAAGALWLALMMILVHRSLPPWPFGSDAESVSFLMPSLESVRDWWLPRVIPLE